MVESVSITLVNKENNNIEIPKVTKEVKLITDPLIETPTVVLRTTKNENTNGNNTNGNHTNGSNGTNGTKLLVPNVADRRTKVKSGIMNEILIFKHFKFLILLLSVLSKQI